MWSSSFCLHLIDQQQQTHLTIHANDAPNAFSRKHEVKCLVYLREGHSVSDEFLELHLLQHWSSFGLQKWKRKKANTFKQSNAYAYLVHVFFNNRRKIRARFVVAKEGTLKSPLIKQIHGMSLECIIFVWHTHKHSNTPTLRRNPDCRIRK